MTNKEAIKILPDMKGAGDDWDKAIDLAIEALKQQEFSQQTAVDDTVSRRAVIDTLCDWICGVGERCVKTHCQCIRRIETLPSVQPEIIRCADCKHRPVTNDNYDDEEWDCGFNIEFPDHKCPCQCDDGWYNRLPDDNWFCGNAERRIDGRD